MKRVIIEEINIQLSRYKSVYRTETILNKVTVSIHYVLMIIDNIGILYCPKIRMFEATWKNSFLY